MIGVVIESAYFLLGSPACIDLVERDLVFFRVLFFEDDLGILNFSLNKEQFCLCSYVVTSGILYFIYTANRELQ